MTFKANTAITERDFFFNPAGSNSNGGFSDEIPVADPQTAIFNVNLLTDPPSPSLPASINASVSGTYDTGVVIPQFTTANCASASIISADSILVECSGRQTVQWGSLLALSPFATIVKIDGRKRVRVVTNSMVVSEDGVGFQVSGNCDEVFIEVVEGVIFGARGVMFNHTATSPTPISYTITEAIFSNIDQTFMVHDPAASSSETLMTFEASQPVAGSVPATTVGSMMFRVKAGTLVVHAGVLVAVCISTVESGALIVMDAQAIFGDTFVEAGGIAVYKSVGTISGNIEAQGVDAVTEIQTETMNGNITVSTGGIATLKTDILTGDIDVAAGGRIFGIVDIHIGTITPTDPDDPRVNGIFGGVRRGNWRVAVETLITPETDIEKVLHPDGAGMVEWLSGFGSRYQFEASEGESSTTSETYQNKVTLTTPSIPAGDYRISSFAEVANDSGDKPVEARVLVDSTTINTEIFYAPKFTDAFLSIDSFNLLTLTAGVHVIEFDFRATSEGGTAKIRRARLEIFRTDKTA